MIIKDHLILFPHVPTFDNPLHVLNGWLVDGPLPPNKPEHLEAVEGPATIGRPFRMPKWQPWRKEISQIHWGKAVKLWVLGKTCEFSAIIAKHVFFRKSLE